MGILINKIKMDNREKLIELLKTNTRIKKDLEHTGTLEERFLRKYCVDRGMKIYFIDNWLWIIVKDKYWIDNLDKSVILGINNKKSFNAQTDRFYSRIFNFLKRNSNEQNTGKKST